MGWFWKRKEILVEKEGWVSIRFSFFLDGKIPRKKIAEECTELIEIFMNGQSFFDQKNNYLGYGNPKINKEIILLTEGNPKEIYARNLSRLFFPEFKKERGGWHITCRPRGKVVLYKIKDLYEDLFILWHIDKNLRERYDIEESTRALFYTTFINNKPAIKYKENLIVMEFKIEDQLKYESNELVKKCLADTANNRIEVVRRNKDKDRTKELTPTEAIERTNWLEEVDKLVQ